MFLVEDGVQHPGVGLTGLGKGQNPVMATERWQCLVTQSGDEEAVGLNCLLWILLPQQKIERRLGQKRRKSCERAMVFPGHPGVHMV